MHRQANTIGGRQTLDVYNVGHKYWPKMSHIWAFVLVISGECWEGTDPEEHVSVTCQRQYEFHNKGTFQALPPYLTTVTSKCQTL